MDMSIANQTDRTAVSRIHTETACDKCHYILKYQEVKRDIATGLLIVRCPECGSIHAATTLSLRRTRWRWFLGKSRIAHFLLAGFSLLMGMAMCITMNVDLGNVVIMSLMLASFLLAASGAIHGWPPLLRIAVLMAPAMAAHGFGPLIPYYSYFADFGPATIAIQFLLPVGVGMGCRVLLRGVVRVCCPNASRYAFEELWRSDGKRIPKGPW